MPSFPNKSVVRSLRSAAILAISLGLIDRAQATIIGFDPANYTLNANGTATGQGVPNIVSDVLNLTTAANDEVTSAYFNTPQTITNFTANFTYDFLNGSGNPADGFAFVLQNQGLNALGGGGGSVGYESVTPSVAVKFNIYNDDGFGVGSGGVTPGTSVSNIVLTGANPVNVSLNYNGTLLAVKLTEQVTNVTETRIYPIGDITSLVGGPTAYVGFSGATGGENAAQALSNFTFTIGTGVVATPNNFFRVRQVRLNTGSNTGNAGGGTNAAVLENIDEGEALLNGTGGFAANGESTAFFQNVNNPFPLGGGDQFATSASGFIDLNNDGLDGDTGTYTLYVDSDDGFRLRLNGTTIGEFFGPTGASNTTIPNVALKDGDQLTLNFFENGGGEKLILRVGDSAGAFVGTPASGIGITQQVPEPASAGMLALGALGLFARRRRA